MIILTPTGNTPAFEDVRNGVKVSQADAILAGFVIPPQHTRAVLAMIQAALNRTPEDNLFSDKWEQITARGCE